MLKITFYSIYEKINNLTPKRREKFCKQFNVLFKSEKNQLFNAGGGKG